MVSVVYPFLSLFVFSMTFLFCFFFLVLIQRIQSSIEFVRLLTHQMKHSAISCRKMKLTTQFGPNRWLFGNHFVYSISFWNHFSYGWFLIDFFFDEQRLYHHSIDKIVRFMHSICQRKNIHMLLEFENIKLRISIQNIMMMLIFFHFILYFRDNLSKPKVNRQLYPQWMYLTAKIETNYFKLQNDYIRFYTNRFSTMKIRQTNKQTKHSTT